MLLVVIASFVGESDIKFIWMEENEDMGVEWNELIGEEKEMLVEVGEAEVEDAIDVSDVGHVGCVGDCVVVVVVVKSSRTYVG